MRHVILLFRDKSLIRFILSTINRIRSRSRSRRRSRERRSPACLPVLAGHMAGKHMTTASTQYRGACADAYRYGRQNVCFRLPKLTSERSKRTMSPLLRKFLSFLFLLCSYHLPFPSVNMFQLPRHLHERQQ